MLSIFCALKRNNVDVQCCFAQFVHVKLASPQAALLSLFLIEKLVVERPELRAHY